jgi:hypothetical protein
MTKLEVTDSDKPLAFYGTELFMTVWMAMDIKNGVKAEIWIFHC